MAPPSSGSWSSFHSAHGWEKGGACRRGLAVRPVNGFVWARHAGGAYHFYLHLIGQNSVAWASHLKARTISVCLVRREWIWARSSSFCCKYITSPRCELFQKACSRPNDGLPKMHILTLRTCDYVPWHAERTLQMWLRIWVGEIFLDNLGGVLIRRRGRQESQREGFDDATLVVLRREKGTMRQEMKASSRSWKRQEMDSLLDPQEGMQPYETFQASCLQDYKVINLCCFKTLSLLQFVTEP